MKKFNEMTSNEKLSATVLDHLSEEQAKFIYEFINVLSNQGLSKGQLMELSGAKESRKVDTATPINAVRAIQEINPSFNPSFNFYDYRVNSYGSFTNVAEELIIKLNNVLNS